MVEGHGGADYLLFVDRKAVGVIEAKKKGTPLTSAGLWPAQETTIHHLEESLVHFRPRALIQMATGSGKTFTAANVCYRLIKHADAGRVLFLPEPPEEQVPIPDYRTMGDGGVHRPSPDLLDTIFACQQRQEWYRDFAEVTREDPVAFVGSLTTLVPVVEAAEQIRATLGFDPSERGDTRSDALRTLVDHAEELGVLVMVSGVVGSNTHRKLDPHEFRGFALVDPLAPLVFINGADTKAAQIFTVTHELVHLFLGETALDDDLATWASERPDAFFLEADTAVVPSLQATSTWANGAGYEPAAVATFLQDAGYYLVAHAHAHHHVVVTHEVVAHSTKKIKIPNACLCVGVRYVTPFEMLRAERARFVIAS